MFPYFELFRKYRSQLTFKYKWIQKTGVILLLTSLLSMVIWFLTINIGHLVCGSEKMLLAISIVLNVVWQYFSILGLSILISYMLWHITLQIYEGLKQAIWIVIMICATLIAVIFLPTVYVSVIGNLVYNQESGLNVTKDLKYVSVLMSSSDITETRTVTIDAGLANRNYFNLYYCINVNNNINSEYAIISYDDAKKLQNELDGKGQLEISVTYNAHTKIVTNYILDYDSNYELNGSDVASDNVEIWLEEKNNGIILVCRPDTIDCGDNLYWHITKDGQFYQNRVAYFKPSDNFLSFAEEGRYTVTLVINYNEASGTYTPISNTIEYTIK